MAKIFQLRFVFPWGNGLRSQITEFFNEAAVVIGQQLAVPHEIAQNLLGFWREFLAQGFKCADLLLNNAAGLEIVYSQGRGTQNGNTPPDKVFKNQATLHQHSQFTRSSA